MPEVTKQHNKTETTFQEKFKSKLFNKISKEPTGSEPNSGVKGAHFQDHKFGESKDYIAFEDSLVEGTKIDIAGQKKQHNKKQVELEAKRKKIIEIQKKYEKDQSQKAKKKVTRGYSCNENDRLKMSKAKSSGLKDDPNTIGLNASKINAKKRDVFKNKKGSEMIAEKPNYKSKRHMENEAIDEKLNTQTFRFTNQFKSEIENDPDYFNEDGTIKDDH